jgi:hypothetical protein
MNMHSTIVGSIKGAMWVKAAWYMWYAYKAAITGGEVRGTQRFWFGKAKAKEGEGFE